MSMWEDQGDHVVCVCVCVCVQMRRAVHAYACCPRHNEPFGVLLASPCTLWQPVQPQAATLCVCMGVFCVFVYTMSLTGPHHRQDVCAARVQPTMEGADLPPVVLACGTGDGVLGALGEVDRHALTDLQIRVVKDGGGGPAVLFWAHRLVLSAASPVVHTILTATGFRESRKEVQDEQAPGPPGHVHGSEITLGGIDPPVFEKLLDFIYRGQVVLEGLEQLLLLYKAADQLDVQPLRVACLDFVGMCLHSAPAGGAGPGGCVELLLLAERLSLECVVRRCQQHIWAHLEVTAVASLPSVWRLLPTSVMENMMRAALTPCSLEDEHVHEVVLAAWADWCGGAWAQLANLSLHTFRSAPALGTATNLRAAPPATPAGGGGVAPDQGLGGDGHGGLPTSNAPRAASPLHGAASPLHPDLSCLSPSSSCATASSSSASFVCDDEEDADSVAGGRGVQETQESGGGGGVCGMMQYDGGEQGQDADGVPADGVPAERVDLLQVRCSVYLWHGFAYVGHRGFHCL